MVFNLGLVGCGKWSDTIISEVKKNKFFQLKKIVCKHRHKSYYKNVELYKTPKEMLETKKIDCIYVASSPKINLDVMKLLVENNLPVILEKPIANSYKNILDLKKISNDHEILALPNITNIFSECSNEIEKFVNKNKINIKRIIIIEGGNGPFRDDINPIWDWGFHSFALIFKLFKKDITNKFRNSEIKKNNINKGLVSKFIFSINNTIKVKIITGNLFQIKKRLIKIILLNGDFLLCDFIKHEVYINNILIFRNSKTPLESLLDNFENIIRNKDYKISSELLDISIRTTKILEKFYKC